MEWITCPSCGLKHSPRPDGLCPRCRTQVGEPGAQRPLPPNPAFDRANFDRPPSPTASQGAGAPEPMPTAPWDGGAAPVPAQPTGASATLSVGSLLSRTFSTWWANVGRFAGALLLAYVPIFAAGAAAAIVIPQRIRANPGLTPQDAARALIPLGVVVAIVAVFFALALVGGITYGTLQHLAGRRAGVGAMLRAGLRRGWPVFLTTVAASVVIGLGFLLLVVPGVMLGMGLMLVIPVIMAEESGGVGQAFRRSFALTRGNRLMLFGAFVVLLVVLWSVSLVGNIATAAAATNSAAGVVGMLLSGVLQILLAPLGTVLCAVAYHDLRVAKEGVDTSQLAKVFE